MESKKQWDIPFLSQYEQNQKTGNNANNIADNTADTDIVIEAGKLKSCQIAIDVSYADSLGLLLDHHIEENDVYDCKAVWEWYQSAKITVKCQYMLAKNPDQCLCFMSMGDQIDQKMDELQQSGHILQAYILECFSMEILRKAYGEWGKYMENQYKIGLGYFHFLDEEEMMKVPAFMEKVHIQDIQCNESLAFIPQKTVVFYCTYEAINGNLHSVNDKCGDICQYCVNIHCPNRKIAENKKDMGTHLSYGFQKIFSQLM